MLLHRHIPFLKQVFLYAVTAFGGPNAHLGLMTRLFVQKTQYVTQSELNEFFSFCQLLPGPSSTQTITLIGYKRGGALLAIFTLITWVLPAAILMGLLSFLVTYLSAKDFAQDYFKYIHSMAIGFLLYAAYFAMRSSVKNIATYSIMIVGALISLLFRSPWVFPLLLIGGGFVTTLSNKRIPETTAKPQKINWNNLWIFFLVFVVAGFLSEFARVHDWKAARAFNLFENFYRFGTIVFGGGHALVPAMYDQFVSLPMSRAQAPIVSHADFLTGYGMMNCVPGPVFSICSYIGGMAMSKYGVMWQGLGCLIGIVGIFLPGLLLILFLFPIYNNLKQHVTIYRALEGINAVVIGIMWASAFVVFKPLDFDMLKVTIAASTFGLLMFTKIPSPFIVLIFLVLGILF